MGNKEYYFKCVFKSSAAIHKSAIKVLHVLNVVNARYCEYHLQTVIFCQKSSNTHDKRQQGAAGQAWWLSEIKELRYWQHEALNNCSAITICCARRVVVGGNRQVFVADNCMASFCLQNLWAINFNAFYCIKISIVLFKELPICSFICLQYINTRNSKAKICKLNFHN